MRTEEANKIEAGEFLHQFNRLCAGQVPSINALKEYIDRYIFNL